MASLPLGVRAKDRDGGAIRIPVTAAAAIDPTDADPFRAPPKWSGEVRLCAAVLASAILDVRRYPPTSREYREARAWLLNDHESGVHAFVAVCALLGYDAAYVRRRALEGAGDRLVGHWLHAAR